MKKSEKERVIKELKEHLKQSDVLWENRSQESLPFIIGYLQGALKTAIIRLEN